MYSRNSNHGFSLVELLIAIAIIAVLSSIALPLYSGYIRTSQEGALVNSISTMEIFQEDFRLRTGAYFAPAANTAAITAAIGWNPRDDGEVEYSIAAAGDSYQVTATDASGFTVCLQLPEKIQCP